jgi:hypothetical protein
VTAAAPQLEDTRVVLARQVLAELPGAEDIEQPYFWIGRLRTALAELVAVAAPGGMDSGQREVLGQALADAIGYRTPDACCASAGHPTRLCDDCAADLDLTGAYLALARELGIELEATSDAAYVEMNAEPPHPPRTIEDYERLAAGEDGGQ